MLDLFDSQDIESMQEIMAFNHIKNKRAADDAQAIIAMRDALYSVPLDEYNKQQIYIYNKQLRATCSTFLKDFSQAKRTQIDDNLLTHDQTQQIRALYDSNFNPDDYTINDIGNIGNILRDTHLFTAKDIFDDYMIYLEWDRDAHKRFYAPRRKQLFHLVSQFQLFYDNDYKELFLSLIPRGGKTMLLTFFYSWIMGKEPERTNLYCSYADNVTKTFYDGILEIITDHATYKWDMVFKGQGIERTDAHAQLIDIDRRKKYPTLTCRSIDGQLNGTCDCDHILCGDDLVSGIEEAKSDKRLASKWETVCDNFLRRAKEGAKIIWCGTRWSVRDPIGRRIDMLQAEKDDNRTKHIIINIPALNDKDESNFDYKYGVGFSTAYFKRERLKYELSNNMASWLAQFCGEPIERHDAVFAPEYFKYYKKQDLYDKLEKTKPELIIMSVDPSWGYSDYVAAPIIYRFAEYEMYLVDVVYTKAGKDVSRPQIIKKATEHNVQQMIIEADKSRAEYGEWIKRKMRENGQKCNIKIKPAGTHKSKEQRILDRAEEILCVKILEANDRSPDYSMFMQNVFMFDATKTRQLDDACFIGETLVATQYGNIPIKNVETGMKVFTPFGLRKVIASEMTGTKQTINNIGLIGTPNHKIYNKTNNKFSRLDSLTSLNDCSTISLKEMISWRIKLLNFKGKYMKETQRADIIFCTKHLAKKKKVQNNYTELFGSFTMEKFQKNTIYIILTAIVIITTLATWSVYQLSSICQGIARKIGKMKDIVKKHLGNLMIFETLQRNGTQVKKAKNGTRTMHKTALRKRGHLENNEYVNGAGKNTQQKSIMQNIAKRYVNKNQVVAKKNSNVKNVEKYLDTTIQESTALNVLEQHAQEVYDITVESAGCFYANGILVSNCDALALAMDSLYCKKVTATVFKRPF